MSEITKDDAEFFAANPSRQYRVRYATESEIRKMQRLIPESLALEFQYDVDTHGYEYFTGIRRLPFGGHLLLTFASSPENEETMRSEDGAAYVLERWYRFTVRPEISALIERASVTALN